MSKIKVLTISDHPLAPSGVGTQTKYVCEALLNTGKFQILSLGGAIKHTDYRPVQIEPYKEDWKVVPVDGFGTQEQIRSILRSERPDILWFMTDPRFFSWLWEIENEVRPLLPMVYYHVWDNFPAPMFNRKFYLSNDVMVSISKLTDEVIKEVAPEVERHHIPHAVMNNVFRPLPEESRQKIREDSLPEEDRDKTVFFWNNRNARRKQSGTLIFWFKEFLDKHDLHDKCQLIMHTDPNDPHGQPLQHLIEKLGLGARQVLLSTQKISPENLAAVYNMADCTINISDAEGFGLATLESLSCGTPIIVNMTGGLQEQVQKNGKEFGIPIFPSSKAVIGSQQVPYIYEDRINKEHFISALNKMYQMGPKNRRMLGLEGRKHVEDNYNFSNFQESWANLMLSVHERHGSWDTRKGYNNIRFLEVA